MNITKEKKSIDYDRMLDQHIMPDFNLDLYTLEIDAESGRKGLPDEKITIYTVQAPESQRKN